MNKGTVIKILDHGYIKLVDWMGSDESIIEAARMSTGKGFNAWLPYYRCKHCGEVRTDFEYLDAREINRTSTGNCHHPNAKPHPDDKLHPDTNRHDWERNPKGDTGLLKYLYEHRHDTPFEMAELVVEVQAPIMAFREWHRHRSQSFNEMSARYVQMPNLHYIPSVDRIIAASKKHRNKQQGGGGELKVPDLYDQIMSEEAGADWVRFLLGEEQQHIYDLYEKMLDWGIAPEVARIDTPVSRYSRMRAKTDLRNWLAFLTLRSDEAAQWEIRQFAYALGYFISRLFPRTWDLWLNVDRRKPEIDKNGFILVEDQ
jgi:thymidylate synthase (FAD)